MNRNVDEIKRNFEKTDNDIINKKLKILEIFKSDPDLQEILGVKSPRPKNKYIDPNNPTKEELEERKRIEEYNKQIKKEQIVPWIKVNELQTEVLNYIMFEIDDTGVSYVNNGIKQQEVIVMIAVLEDEMDTEYGIPRADLLSYIVKDLLCWANDLGMQLKLVLDKHGLMDFRYYSRTLRFAIEAPNSVKYGGSNRYDRY